MKIIQLTRGQSTTVDDSDYDRLMQWKWTAKERSSGDGFFYAKRNTKSHGTQKVIYMARQIMGHPEGMDVDHINGNSLDNQRANLRIVTHQQNLLNSKRRSDNRSGFKGVCAARKKWRAEIKANGKRIRLGHFDSPELAHAAYADAARKYHGEYAYKGGA